MNKKIDEEYKGIKDIYILQCICSELKFHLQQKENIRKEVIEYIETKEKDDDNWVDYELLIEPIKIKELLYKGE